MSIKGQSVLRGLLASAALKLRTDDKGASAVLIAMVMVVILGIAALTVDAAAGWNERRQDQTASDLSAVAGGLSFGDNDAIAAQVKATARANVDTTYTNAEWTALWTGCTDPGRPLGYTALVTSSGTEQCISINPSFLRVRLPDQVIEAAFGRTIGIDTLTTNADAIVTLFPLGGNGALPFAIRGNSTSGEICLDTSTGSKIVPPCDGNEQGSFGNIAPPIFGNPIIGTSPQCSGQTASGGYIAESIAMGIDHLILSMSSAAWSAGGLDPDRKQDAKYNLVDPFSNMDECNDTGGEIAEAADGVPINAVIIDTGNSVKDAITEGTMTGTGYADGADARLTRTGPQRSVDGIGLDNVPLWNHLLPGASPSECDGSTYAALPDIDTKNTQMRDCLKNWTPADGQIIADSILGSARLGVAPRIWFNVYGSGIGASPVKAFDLVYIHALFFNDNADTVFYPGDGNGSITLNGPPTEIEQMTAYLLDPGMVSDNVTAIYPGITGEFSPTLYE